MVTAVRPPSSQVPLIIFKREKQVARQLEDKLLWVKQSPSRAMEYWDGLVISSTSFPKKYWDKQVKQRVRETVASGVGSTTAQCLAVERTQLLRRCFGK